MKLSFLKQTEQTDWLDNNELHDLQILAAQLDTSTQTHKKQYRQQAGQLNSRVTGSGSDYAESRPYQQGDDPRSINWRLSARSQETFVKTYYADSLPSLNLLLDQRHNMLFGTRKRLKISQALRAALLLGYAGSSHGLHFKAWLINDTSANYFANFDDFLFAANQCQFMPEKKLPASTHPDFNTLIKNILPQLPSGSLFYIISDFAGFQKQPLATLAQHCQLEAIHILDQAEIELTKSDTLLLQDREGLEVKVDTRNKTQRLEINTNLKSVIDARKKRLTDLNINYSRILTQQKNIQKQIYLPIKSTL